MKSNEYDRRTVKQKSQDWYSAAVKDTSKKSLSRKVQKAQRVDKADRNVSDKSRVVTKSKEYGAYSKGASPSLKEAGKRSKKDLKQAKKTAKKARNSY